MGVLGGLIHAIATVTFGVDHIVSGVAINIVGLGVAKYLAARFFTGLPAEQAVDDDVLATAMDNMERHFAFVGLVERMADTTVRLSAMLGVHLDVEHLNVTPRCAVEGHDDRSDARVAPFVAYDLRLYDQAKKLFWHRDA